MMVMIGNIFCPTPPMLKTWEIAVSTPLLVGAHPPSRMLLLRRRLKRAACVIAGVVTTDLLPALRIFPESTPSPYVAVAHRILAVDEILFASLECGAIVAALGGVGTTTRCTSGSVF